MSINRHCNFRRWKWDQKETEFFFKDKVLKIWSMWIFEPKTIPVITEKIETVLKSCKKHLSNIPVKHDIKDLQKTAIFGNAHIFGGC